MKHLEQLTDLENLIMLLHKQTSWPYTIIFGPVERLQSCKGNAKLACLTSLYIMPSPLSYPYHPLRCTIHLGKSIILKSFHSIHRANFIHVFCVNSFTHHYSCTIPALFRSIDIELIFHPFAYSNSLRCSCLLI